MSTALEIAIAAQERRERTSPLPAVAAISESISDAHTESSVRGQARALLWWASEQGESDHPIARDLRKILTRWDFTGRSADSGYEIIDALVQFYLHLPGSTSVVAARDPQRWGIL